MGCGAELQGKRAGLTLLWCGVRINRLGLQGGALWIQG